MSNVEKIASLLAMAERTDNAAEAEAFMQKAQTLATLHSVDLAIAQSKIAQREKRDKPIHRQITIGERGKRANKHLVHLFSTVAANNDVTVDVAHNSTYVIAFGFESDADVTEAMWGSLAYQMVEAANAYVKSGEWKGETYITDYYYDSAGQVKPRTKPHTAMTARNSFYRGYINRIGERLAVARADALKQARDAERETMLADAREAADAAKDAAREATSGTDLVLKGKTEEVASYYKQASTARGSWKGYQGRTESTGRAAKAGWSAASNARLSSSKGIGSRAGELSA